MKNSKRLPTRLTHSFGCSHRQVSYTKHFVLLDEADFRVDDTWENNDPDRPITVDEQGIRRLRRNGARYTIHEYAWVRGDLQMNPGLPQSDQGREDWEDDDLQEAARKMQKLEQQWKKRGF